MEFLTREKGPVLSGEPDPGDPEDSSLVNLDWFVGTEPGEYIQGLLYEPFGRNQHQVRYN